VNTDMTLGFHKACEFLDDLSSYQLLKKDSNITHLFGCLFGVGH